MKPWHLLGIVVVLTLGCMEGQKPTPLQRVAPLYDRLGRETAISKVVSDFVDNVVADEKIKENHKRHFREGDVAALKKKLIDQIGEATGGPQKYTGKNMKDAHRGLAISNADFDALVADLVKALDNNKVADTEKSELLGMLGKMRSDIVE